MKKCLRNWSKKEYQFELLHQNLSWKRYIVKKVDRSNITCKVSNFEIKLLLSYSKLLQLNFNTNSELLKVTSV